MIVRYIFGRFLVALVLAGAGLFLPTLADSAADSASAHSARMIVAATAPVDVVTGEFYHEELPDL